MTTQHLRHRNGPDDPAGLEQLIHQAFAEAAFAPSDDARAQAFVASLSTRLLMSGDLQLGNAIGTLIGLRRLDADEL